MVDIPYLQIEVRFINRRADLQFGLPQTLVVAWSTFGYPEGACSHCQGIKRGLESKYANSISMKDTGEQVIVGVDIGSWSFKISAFKEKQFGVLTNEANFRETPSLVSFFEKQRLVGEEAQNKIKSNCVNTVRAPLRLIGLERNLDLLDEQLKYCAVKYEANDEIEFSVRVEKDKQAAVKPEHLLIALLNKMLKIIKSHQIAPVSYCLTVPSYFSHFERKLIKNCGEVVLGSAEVILVDDWLSIASEYAYNHIVEISEDGKRTVVFVDVGYSKCSIFVIEFGSYQPQLLDCEHMRFVGSRNMDHLLTEYYDSKIKHSRNSEDSLFSSHKAVAKLMDHVQKQRKVLSANEEYHLLAESLFEDYDLSYNMCRKELEQIVAPVLEEIRAGLANIRYRMPYDFKLHSVELVGGTSRMPSVQSIIKDTFGVEPSRTLNLSESSARGANIYGAVLAGLTPLSYKLTNGNLVDICFSYNSTKHNAFFGENEAQYKNKQVAFAANCPVPNEFPFNFNRDEGLVELYVYYGQSVSTKSIGYLRFKTPNHVHFTIDQSKIIHVTLDYGKFEVCKMQDKKASQWAELAKWEKDHRALEERILVIYELKNSFEGQLYEMRGKIGEYKEFMNQQEHESFLSQFTAAEQWIEAENNRPLSSVADLELYRKEMKQLKEYEEAITILKERMKASQGVRGRYQALCKSIDGLPAASLDPGQLKKVVKLVEWLKDSYGKMQACNWEGYYLNDSSLQFAEDELRKILTP